MSQGGIMETAKVNMHQMERIVSAGLGGVLLLRSLPRRSLGGAALASALLYRGISGHSYLYQALGLSTNGTGASAETPEVECSITIGKSANELYRFWREPQNLSQILGEVGQVTQVSGGRQHWVVNGPFNQRLEWDTQIVEDRPGEMVRWKSVDGASLPNEGLVHFRPAPGDRGTEVTLYFRFDPPGGTLGNTLAKRLGIVPRMAAEKVLRRFKSLVETGEIPTLKHNPAARPGAYAHT
jgi:uncharacterized membrane protein